jgi:predicted metal-binding membrane protein
MPSAADTAPMPDEAGPIEAARRDAAARRLRLEDLVVLGCLAAAALLAWLWLAGGAATDHAMAMPSTWSAAYLGPAFAMWALMMVAMMLPSAAPMILLHARVAGHRGRRAGWLESLLFALAYVAVWTGFAAAAALAQAALIAAGLLHAVALSTGDAGLAAALLAAAGVYQFSEAKRACLHQCRSPLSFILRSWRPGLSGAMRLGFRHGLYCLGCCWLLMVLLFVGGVMNLAWIAALATLFIAEKYAPRRWRLSRLVGIGLLAAATAVFLAY